MSEIDAAEIARLRAGLSWSKAEKLSLLDELEQARGKETYWKTVAINYNKGRDSARALLRQGDAIADNMREFLRRRFPDQDYGASALAEAIDAHRARITEHLKPADGFIRSHAP